MQFATRTTIAAPVGTGPVTSMVTRSIPDPQPSFDEFAACLKAAAESAAGASR